MNKVYFFLDDPVWLKQNLIEEGKSMSGLAREICRKNSSFKYANIKGSLRYQVLKHFGKSPELMAKVGRQKAFHKKNKV